MNKLIMKILPAIVSLTVVALVFLFSPLSVNAFDLDTSCQVGGDNAVVYEEDLPVPTNIYITTAALNLRPTPSTDLPRIALAPLGALVTVTDYLDGEWFAVTFNGLSGFMSAEFLEPHYIVPFIPPDLSGLAPVEIIDWHTANDMIPVRTPFTIIDVRTGIFWQAARLGGELHADVEPLTAQDTANMHRAFNHRWTWDPRPVVVIVDGRTLAASINGMPHSIVTIHNNNVDGHFCLHFFGSMVHGTFRVDQRHHDAVIEAFLTAFTW
ncbi:MAG: SH3 domain-containing protein [Defluviitaleaceae bacterium]|nr:SH3 domain-containing protein [Defluviitaleaceae bacterium]